MVPTAVSGLVGVVVPMPTLVLVVAFTAVDAAQHQRIAGIHFRVGTDGRGVGERAGAKVGALEPMAVLLEPVIELPRVYSRPRYPTQCSCYPSCWSTGARQSRWRCCTRRWKAQSWEMTAKADNPGGPWPG